MNSTRLPVESLLSRSGVAVDMQAISHAAEERVWLVAKRALWAIGQLALAGGVNAAILSCCVATYLPYIQLAVALAIAAVVIRVSWMFFAHWRGIRFGVDPSFHVEKHIAGFSLVNAIGQAGFNIFIHEFGHAAAAALCYRRSSIEILIKPFLGGMTSYTEFYGSTLFGKWTGSECARALCIAGGILSATAFAMTEFAAAWHLYRNNQHTAAKLLAWHGISLLANNVLYGLGALFTYRGDLVNDFVALWQRYGIHPVAPVAVMVALPILEIGVLILLDKVFYKNDVPQRSLLHEYKIVDVQL